MLNRSNIEEANKHLQALYGRINDLERIVQDQHEALLAKDSFIQTKINELSKQDTTIQTQGKEIQEKDNTIAERDQLIALLDSDLKEKEKEMKVMSQRNEVLGKLLSLIPELKSVVGKFDEVTAGSLHKNGVETASSGTSTYSEADGDNTVHQKLSELESPTTKQFSKDSLTEKISFHSQSSQPFDVTEKVRKLSMLNDEELLSDEETKGVDKTVPKEIYF